MATISSNTVTAEYGGDIFRIKVEEGVRGFNIPVAAVFSGGAWQITLEGKRLTVVEVMKLVPEARQSL